MRKTFILSCLLTLGMFAYVHSQVASPPPKEGDIVPPPPDSSGAWGRVFKLFERTKANFSLDLWVRTRDTNDSVKVTVQSSNELVDTLGWTNLTNFGGAKTALGHKIGRASCRERVYILV